jgi:hypothetical protein
MDRLVDSNDVAHLMLIHPNSLNKFIFYYNDDIETWIEPRAVWIDDKCLPRDKPV